MDKKIAMDWADALESGDYVQGRSRLNNQGSDGVHRYCCLGVLAEMAVEEGVIRRGETNIFGTVAYLDTNGPESALLPRLVKLWAGMESQDGALGNDVALTMLNDGAYADGGGWDVEPRTFVQIAKVIRENWEAL